MSELGKGEGRTCQVEENKQNEREREREETLRSLSGSEKH